jgi:hypothetical protein
MVKQSDLEAVTGLVTPLVGKPAWMVCLGFGASLMINFGRQLDPDKFGRSHGEWHLWLEGCEWRIDYQDRVLVGGEDSREKMQVAVRELEGRKLLAVSLNSPAMDAVFEFEGDLSLRTFAVNTTELDSWNLFTPEHKVLVVGPGAKWSYTRSDTPYQGDVEGDQ